MEEVLEAAVEERPEVVGDSVIGREEEVEVVGSVLVEGEEVVGSVLAEGEEVVEEEAVTRISRDQEHLEGAVHSGIVRSFGATCTVYGGFLPENNVFRQLENLGVLASTLC